MRNGATTGRYVSTETTSAGLSKTLLLGWARRAGLLRAKPAVQILRGPAQGDDQRRKDDQGKDFKHHPSVSRERAVRPYVGDPDKSQMTLMSVIKIQRSRTPGRSRTIAPMLATTPAVKQPTPKLLSADA